MAEKSKSGAATTGGAGGGDAKGRPKGYFFSPPAPPKPRPTGSMGEQFSTAVNDLFQTPPAEPGLLSQPVEGGLGAQLGQRIMGVMTAPRPEPAPRAPGGFKQQAGRAAAELIGASVPGAWDALGLGGYPEVETPGPVGSAAVAAPTAPQIGPAHSGVGPSGATATYAPWLDEQRTVQGAERGVKTVGQRLVERFYK